MKNKFFSFLLAGTLFSITLAGTINKVSFVGNLTVPEVEILKVIISKPGELFVTDNVLNDLNLIYETGQFKDDISVEPLILKDGNVELVFKVTENPYIKRIEFVGLSTFSPATLLVSMNCKEGQVLNYNNLRNDIRALRNFYHDRGYILMSVAQVIEPDESGGLIFVLNEGQIEDIFIKGLTYTKEFVITREMETKPGEAFNIKTFQEDMRSIYNTGFFETVNIEPPVGGVDPKKVIAIVNIKEKRSGSFQFGGGVGSASGFFGFIQLEFMNFLGEGYNTRLKAQWGEKQSSYEFKYNNPWFLNDRTWLTYRMWHTSGLVDEGQGLDAYNTGGELSLGKPLTKEISVYGTGRLNLVRPYDPIIAPVTNAIIDSYSIRSLGLGIIYDTRDYRFNPSSGEYVNLWADSSLKAFGSSIEYLKTKFRVNKYFPLGQDFALGFLGQSDFAWGTILDTERYFAGGSTTVRGYQDGTPFAVGGARVMGTVELRYKINESMNIYAFYDMGKVGQGFADVNFAGDSNLRTGKGVGLKVITPLGPLRFDFAWADGNNYGGYKYDTNNNQSYTLKQGTQMQIHFNFENSF